MAVRAASGRMKLVERQQHSFQEASLHSCHVGGHSMNRRAGNVTRHCEARTPARLGSQPVSRTAARSAAIRPGHCRARTPSSRTAGRNATVPPSWESSRHTRLRPAWSSADCSLEKDRASGVASRAVASSSETSDGAVVPPAQGTAQGSATPQTEAKALPEQGDAVVEGTQVPADKPPFEIGFTRRNELLVGRVAMMGFGASLVGEFLTGKGPLAQLKMETGIPIYEAEPLLLFFILFTAVGAVRGLDSRGSAKFVLDTDRAKHDKMRERRPQSLRGWLGLPESGPLFAFSTPNELFVGRMAQLGFACALIGEIVTGKGALAQLRFETGIPVTEVEPLIILSISFFFLSAINPETGRFFKNEDED